MSRWIRKIGGILAGLMILILPIVVGNEVFATNNLDFMYRVMLNNVEGCYKNALVSSIRTSEYMGYDSLMNNGYKSNNGGGNIIVPFAPTREQLKKSNNVFGSDTFDSNVFTISCYQLFFNENSGLLKDFIKDFPSTANAVYTDGEDFRKLMQDELKYNAELDNESTSSGAWCYEATERRGRTGLEDPFLGRGCIKNPGEITSQSELPPLQGRDAAADYIVEPGKCDFGDNGVCFSAKYVGEESDGEWRDIINGSQAIIINDLTEQNISLKSDNLADELSELSIEIRYYYRPGESDAATVNGQYLFTKDNGKWKEFVNSLLSDYNRNYDNIEFTDGDKYDVYKEYLRYYTIDGNIVDSKSTCQSNKPSNLVDAAAGRYWVRVKNKGWCLANLDKNAVNDEHTMGVFTKSERRKINKTIHTLPELIELMGELDLEDDDMTDINQDAQSDENSVVPGQTEEPENGGGNRCAASGAGGSLGWIVCPILDWMGEAANGIYQDLLEPRLQISAELFSTSDTNNGATKKAWEIFQNMANIIFVILFLVVIFSQLTGVGIDNYGIKKILPKLIVVAILVNLSYYICVFFVDVSNILGSGLRDLFVGLGEGIEINIDGYGNGAGITVLSVLVLSAAAAGGLYVVWTNPAILLGLLVAGLGVVIALFFLFLLLAAREAAIIVFVVISPLAFVCYMLPNTKKFFDKWLNISKGLLLVYPVAGLLMGGGNFVSRVLLASGAATEGFSAAFAAMIVGVAPIFFIPVVLRGAFSAMGNLGARISGLGNRLRTGATGRIRNSNVYKGAQERSSERRTRIRAGLDKDGNPVETGRLGRFMRGGKRNMARARSQYLKDQDTRKRENSLMGTGYGAAKVAQEKRAGADEVNNEMVLLRSETNDGADEDRIVDTFNESMALADEALERGDEAKASEYINRARAAARLAGRRNDTASRFAEATFLNDNNNYNSTALSKIAKEISEGETSKSYRAGSPLAFEYMARLNDRTAVGADGVTSANSFGDWISNKDNIHNAIEHHVPTSQALMGVQGRNLGQLADLAQNGGMNSRDAEFLQKVSQEAIRTNKENGTEFDFSKAESIYRLAYGEDKYRQKMEEDGIGNLAKRGARSNGASGNFAGSGDSSEMYVRQEAAAQAQTTRQRTGVVLPTGGTGGGDGGDDEEEDFGGGGVVVRHGVPERSSATGGESGGSTLRTAEGLQGQPRPQVTQGVQTPSTLRQNSGGAIDLRTLEDDTVLDIATNPNIENGDATQEAAQREYIRRHPDYEPTNSGGVLRATERRPEAIVGNNAQTPVVNGNGPFGMSGVLQGNGTIDLGRRAPNPIVPPRQSETSTSASETTSASTSEQPRTRVETPTINNEAAQRKDEMSGGAAKRREEQSRFANVLSQVAEVKNNQSKNPPTNSPTNPS